ncbi:MAG: hypothetical protein R2806_09730 [Saprospiraceae bacterium]
MIDERPIVLEIPCRSILFAGLARGVLWYSVKQKWNLTYVILGLGGLILIDLWGVEDSF